MKPEKIMSLGGSLDSAIFRTFLANKFLDHDILSGFLSHVSAVL